MRELHRAGRVQERKILVSGGNRGNMETVLLPDTTLFGYPWQLAASGLISSHIKDMDKVRTKAHPAHSATVEQFGYSLTTTGATSQPLNKIQTVCCPVRTMFE